MTYEKLGWVSWADSLKSKSLFLGSALKKHNLELILVVPPKRNHKDAFDNTHYEKLYDYVAGFSLMTYDFSNLQRPGEQINFNDSTARINFFNVKVRTPPLIGWKRTYCIWHRKRENVTKS